jgi:hypothetical protein
VRLAAPHAALEERVIIYGRRGDLLVAPAVEDRHHLVLDRAAQTRLRAEVVAHTVRDFRERIHYSSTED